MQLLKSFVRAIEKASDWIGKSVSFLVLICIFLVTFELVLRNVFNTSTMWVEESALLVYGTYIILGAVYVSVHRRHVNVDVLYRRLPHRGQAIADVVTSIFFFFFVGLLLWKGGELAWSSIKNLEHSQTMWRPVVYPFKAMIPLGAFLVLLQGLAKFVCDLNMAITGKKLS